MAGLAYVVLDEVQRNTAKSPDRPCDSGELSSGAARLLSTRSGMDFFPKNPLEGCDRQHVAPLLLGETANHGEQSMNHIPAKLLRTGVLPHAWAETTLIGSPESEQTQSFPHLVLVCGIK